MSDLELLELAAKAAGIDPYRIRPCQRENGPNPYIEPWNPLTDDGDALRLAVKLMITIQFPWDEKERHMPETRVWTDFACEFAEPHGTDPYAATRRAIVRAAAAIAKGEGSDE